MAQMLAGPSRLIDLPAFKEEIAPCLSSYLPPEDCDARLNDLPSNQRRWLANRLDDLRNIGDRVFRRPQRLVELDIWQKARYLAGSDDEAAIAAMQEKIIEHGGKAARHTTATKKGKGKARADTVEVEDEMDSGMPGDDAAGQVQFEAMPNGSATHGEKSRYLKPPDENIAKGLEMYAAFSEAPQYMTWLKKADNNTLLNVRMHARGFAKEFGMTNEQISDGHVPDDDPGPPDLAEPTLLLSFTYLAMPSLPKTTRKIEVVLLSSQTLANLRDSLLCPSDATPAKQLDGSHERYGKVAAEKGSIFLIEETVYSDTRAIKTDLSLLFRDQLARATRADGQAPMLGTSAAFDGPSYSYSDSGMHETRLGDLQLRVGQPYWLMHQGDCEHLFTLDAVRLVHPNDLTPLHGPECPYPLTTMVGRINADRCRICNRDPATRTLIGDELVGDAVSPICDNCFQLLHGDGGELSTDLAERKRQQDQAETNARSLGAEVVTVLEQLPLR